VKASMRYLRGLVAALAILGLWLVPVPALAATRPSASSASPSVVAAAGGTSVTITGKNLKQVSAVYFGKTKATSITHLSSTKLRVTAPKHAVGTVSVKLRIGKHSYSTKVKVRYSALPVPGVATISPSSGRVSGGTRVTLTGTNLGSATKVTFSSRTAQILAHTDNSVTVSTPAWLGGTARVTVSTPGGSATTTFLYTSYSREASTEEAAVFQLTNHARSTARDCGATHMPAVPALTWNGTLAEAALAHSKDMIAKDYFAHETMPEDISFDTRITRDGYAWRALGENIAAGRKTPAEVVKAWLKSPGHCVNIMSSSVTELGVARASGGEYGIYWTQDFGKPSS
jgi:uncharacterized protein YkwD